MSRSQLAGFEGAADHAVGTRPARPGPRGGQGRRPGRPRSGVGRDDLRGPLRLVEGRINEGSGFPPPAAASPAPAPPESSGSYRAFGGRLQGCPLRASPPTPLVVDHAVPSFAVAFEHRLAHRAQGKAWVSLQLVQMPRGPAIDVRFTGARASRYRADAKPGSQPAARSAAATAAARPMPDGISRRAMPAQGPAHGPGSPTRM